MRKRVVPIVTVAFVMALMLAVACEANQQSDSDQDKNDKQEKASKQGGASDDLVVRDIKDVDEATIFIHAKGGLEDVYRQVGAKNVQYPWGSGFIISPDGLAVTNNHVVTGSSFLNVYVGGDEEKRSAEYLGVSECSDLALIDLEGNDYPYLEWRDGTVEGGLEVYAAGFPKDPVEENPQIPLDYNIIDGIIQAEEVSGQHSWASIDSVLQHSAITRGGNSGGPLVDKNAKAVGVNYAGIDDQLGEPTEINYAIASNEANEVIAQLRKGDYQSIGVNGYATTHEDLVPESIAVNQVKAGTPAEAVGLQGITVLEAHGHVIQDFIVSLGGSDLAKKETMQEYCNILRGRGPGDPITIEVRRLTYDIERDEIIGEQNLSGVLNGRRLSPEEEVPHSQGEHQMN